MKTLLHAMLHVAIALFVYITAAWAEPFLVKEGENAVLDCTCRIKGDGILFTTSENVAKDEGQKRSHLFLPSKAYRPIIVIAAGKGRSPNAEGLGGTRGPKEEFMIRLPEKVTSLEVGKKTSLEFESSLLQGLKDGDRFGRVNRVWHRDKDTGLTPEAYRAMTRQEPVVGQIVPFHLGIPAEVVEVTDSEVVLRLVPKHGMTVKTAFGQGTVSEKSNGVEITIAARVGTLLTTAGLIGRISEVTDTTITVDYGHPFGGETLQCDVTVLKIERTESTAEKKDRKAGLRSSDLPR